MNKDKVYLGGYVVGHTADTLGYRGIFNSPLFEVEEVEE